MEKNNLDFEEVRYLYNIPEIGLFESAKLIDGLEFISVNQLEEELLGQGSFLHINPDTDKLEEDSPLKNFEGRGEFEFFVVCKEGVFTFNDYCYELVGEFSKENIKRIKKVYIPKNIFITHLSEIQLIKAGTYEILNCEEIKLSNGKKHLIFEIETYLYDIAGVERLERVKVPDYPDLFSIRDCDLLAVNFTEDYIIEYGL